MRCKKLRRNLAARSMRMRRFEFRSLKNGVASRRNLQIVFFNFFFVTCSLAHYNIFRYLFSFVIHSRNIYELQQTINPNLNVRDSLSAKIYLEKFNLFDGSDEISFPWVPHHHHLHHLIVAWEVVPYSLRLNHHLPFLPPFQPSLHSWVFSFEIHGLESLVQ